ncbi:MAG: amidohydrolase family protein [Christensenellales bacterium]|jgi:predicted TIM-barrel fold metal-dependent hydrolase
MTIRDEAFQGKPVSAFVVDAHTHIGPYYMSGWYQSPQETTTGAIVRSMDRLGIDCIVTAPHPLVMGMMAVANETTAAAISDFPGRIYGYICVCPGEGMEAVREQIGLYADHPGFLGLKFLPGYHGSLTQPEYRYAAGFANDRRCVVLTHTWGNSPPLNEVEELAQMHPSMKLLCAHQGGGSADLSRSLSQIMASYPNLYMEICGSLSNPLAIEDLVAIAGEDRVIYGSDLINLDPRYDFGRVVFSPLPDGVKRKILSGNFLSLLRDSGMGGIAER